MRNLLLLALLLYNIVSEGSRLNAYDYDDLDANKRHSFGDDRRNWRKKALLKPFDQEHKDWEDRRYEQIPRYFDDSDAKHFGTEDRQRDDLVSALYRGQRRYEDVDKMNMLPRMTSAEIGHPAFMEKDPDKKTFTMSCERQHERYEACFAGCSAVSCDNPRERLRPCYPFCEPGCVCVRPYVRDDRTHKCVLPDDCTKGLKGIPDLGDDT